MPKQNVNFPTIPRPIRSLTQGLVGGFGLAQDKVERDRKHRLGLLNAQLQRDQLAQQLAQQQEQARIEAEKVKRQQAKAEGDVHLELNKQAQTPQRKFFHYKGMLNAWNPLLGENTVPIPTENFYLENINEYNALTADIAKAQKIKNPELQEAEMAGFRDRANNLNIKMEEAAKIAREMNKPPAETPAEKRAAEGFETPAVQRAAEHTKQLELKQLGITSREKIAANAADAAAKKHKREEARGDSRKIRFDIEKETLKFSKKLKEDDPKITPLELRLQELIFRDRMMERVFLDPYINIPTKGQGGSDRAIGDETKEDLLRMLAK